MKETIEECKDTQSLLKRSRTMINYFKKTAATDKLMQGLLVCICLAVLVVIILGMMGKGGSSVNSKLLPPIENN